MANCSAFLASAVSSQKETGRLIVKSHEVRTIIRLKQKCYVNFDEVTFVLPGEAESFVLDLAFEELVA